MSNPSSTFESLPNEILIDLYEYFDVLELYKAFHNLNSRFNSLLQSLLHLSLYFQSPNDNLIDYNLIFSSQIHTLTIHSQQNLQLNQFFNLHRLTLWYPTDEQILQINGESFPYLEYLSVSFTMAKSSICSLYEKIFSNKFPLLKSCFLSGCDSPIDTIEWKQSPNLQYLYITSNYPSILTACPNLYFLNLAMPSLHNISMNLKSHLNLKRMRLILTSIVWLEDEKNFEILFFSMPNIEQLCLNRIFSITNAIDLLINYDWLSRILMVCLPLLKEFKYYIYILNLFNLDQTDLDKKLPEVRKNFLEIYKNQSKFNMNTSLEDLPNELILEIFNYTHIRDLPIAFWNLNQRFNQLIRSLKYLSLVLNKNDIYESYFFSKQIIRIVIVTLEDICLNPFINLRSLVLNWANEKHLKQIRSEILPNLVFLSLPLSFDFQSTKELASQVFSNRFTYLRSADLGRIGTPDVSSWSQSPSLRSLKIVSPNINIIPLILQSCIQLTHFQVRIIGEHDLDVSSIPFISNHPLKQFTFTQSQSSTFVFDISNILYLIPNLKQLDLRLCTRSFIDLIVFISQNMIYMKQFDCHIIEYPNKVENININILRNIHPCFNCIQCTLREDYFCLYTSKKDKKKSF